MGPARGRLEVEELERPAISRGEPAASGAGQRLRARGTVGMSLDRAKRKGPGRQGNPRGGCSLGGQ